MKYCSASALRARQKRNARLADRSSFTQTAAETAALKALAFLVEGSGAMERFMALSGTDANTIRERADDPEFLAAVMDFLLSDDALLTGFCQREVLDTRTLHLMRHALPGG